MKFKTYNLDCRDVMDMFLPDNSVDSIVTDPPYGLSFMGKGWDHGVPSVEFWERALRVLKPGGHLLAFGGPRTYHRLACAIEDAGFEIRDSVMWMFSSGFPKSLDVSKAIDKAAGAEREVTEVIYNYSGEKRNCMAGDYSGNRVITAPSTELAQQWDGWGTALKPAYEPVVVARKPLIGTVIQNVLMHGVGGLNIDGCRVPGTPEPTRFDPSKHVHDGWRMTATGADCAENASPIGRWPANLIHDGSAEVVALFPANGVSKSGGVSSRGRDSTWSPSKGMNTPGREVPRTGHDDSGSAARFFYVPKASKKDRDEGLTGFAQKQASGLPMRASGGERGGEGMDGTATDRTTTRANNHPTVKPTDLMAYLCRLVTPPGGVVLDPFMGSGSTGKAALREGFRFIGCELEPEYHAIADARLKAAV